MFADDPGSYLMQLIYYKNGNDTQVTLYHLLSNLCGGTVQFMRFQGVQPARSGCSISAVALFNYGRNIHTQALSLIIDEYVNK